jgi:hypothetical protein
MLEPYWPKAFATTAQVSLYLNHGLDKMILNLTSIAIEKSIAIENVSAIAAQPQTTPAQSRWRRYSAAIREFGRAGNDTRGLTNDTMLDFVLCRTGTAV